MDKIFFIYLISCALAVIAVFAVLRWIEFGFTKIEDKRRCKMVKACIRCYTDGQEKMVKNMTKTMIKTINDNVFEMARRFEDL